MTGYRLQATGYGVPHVSETTTRKQVEIVLAGKDQTAPAAQSATANLAGFQRSTQQIGQIATKSAGAITGLTGSLGQLSPVAGGAANALSLIGQMAGGIDPATVALGGLVAVGGTVIGILSSMANAADEAARRIAETAQQVERIVTAAQVLAASNYAPPNPYQTDETKDLDQRMRELEKKRDELRQKQDDLLAEDEKDSRTAGGVARRLWALAWGEAGDDPLPRQMAELEDGIRRIDALLADVSAKRDRAGERMIEQVETERHAEYEQAKAKRERTAHDAILAMIDEEAAARQKSDDERFDRRMAAIAAEHDTEIQMAQRLQEEQDRYAQSAQQAVEQLTRSLETPAEKLGREMGRLQDMLAEGLIDNDLFQRASEQLRQGAAKGGAPVIERSFARTAFLPGERPELRVANSQLREQQRIAKAAEEQKRLLEQIAQSRGLQPAGIG